MAVMTNTNLPKNLLPVTCPVCGENQNTMIGGFDVNGLPVGTVNCMVCRHTFQRDDYIRALEIRRQEFARVTGPSKI